MKYFVYSNIRLTAAATSGVTDPSRGATINYNQGISMVTISPSNSPYGVFEWENTIEVTNELTEQNSSALLVITRKLGSYGDVVVSYETATARELGLNERAAQPGVDYTPVKSSMVMREGEREAYVLVQIMHRK